MMLGWLSLQGLENFNLDYRLISSEIPTSTAIFSWIHVKELECRADKTQEKPSGVLKHKEDHYIHSKCLTRIQL